jgi:hypothetical protein
MPRLRVGGIGLLFEYQFPDYFSHVIDPYLDDSVPVQHEIHVHLDDDFDVPPHLTLHAHYRNRYVYHDNGDVYIVAYDEAGRCKQRIHHDAAYHHVHITLHKDDDPARLAELEYVLTGMVFMELALLHGRIALHASAIAVHKGAVLFTAPSGTGKSTHAGHWMEQYNAFYINDDKPLLFEQDGTLFVTGSPWCGKDLKQSATTRPLTAIIVLEQGDNILYTMSNKDKLVNLFQNVIRPRNETLTNLVSSFLETLITNTTIVRYSASIDQQSAILLHDILFGGESHDNQTGVQT